MWSGRRLAVGGSSGGEKTTMVVGKILEKTTIFLVLWSEKSESEL